jgi:GAF domain-containing protein
LGAAEGLDPDGLPSAEAFARLASELQGVGGVEETVDAVVQFAPQAVACRYAAVVLITRGRRLEIMATTSPLLAELYRRQIDAGAGPLITAVENGETILIRDTSAEARWSETWSEQVSAAGIRSSVHLPLLRPWPRRSTPASWSASRWGSSWSLTTWTRIVRSQS